MSDGNWKITARALAIAASAMQVIVANLVRRQLNAGEITDEDLVNLKDNTLFQLKNTTSEGVSIEDEAKAGRQAVELFEQLFDRAIVMARGKDELF